MSNAAAEVGNDTVSRRFRGMLDAALGPTILRAVDDPKVVEIMANADGTVWIDRAGAGRSCIGAIEPHRAESVIRLVADHMGEAVGRDHPVLSGTMPYTGQRFQGQLPPITEHPVFCIRKRAEAIFTLDDYVSQEVMTAAQVECVREAIDQRQNILIAGGTGSGKTTLANAVLAEPQFAQDRVLIIEDTRELQCRSPDRVELLTKPTDPAVTMNDLVKCALRLRPDRIVVGEVRGGEALALLKAWNTGHPGGLATLHANSTEDALSRLEDLVGEVSRHVPHRAIARTIQLIVFVRRTHAGRRVEAICRVSGFDGAEYRIEPIDDN
jgi:type IV secretion system protein VirB11